jgi:hypothetical protein
MTSVDADLRCGRRLETGRRSESIIHIENILLSIYKHRNVLRKLKYKFLGKI